MVKVFRSVFSMTNLQSSLVQSAYYGAYFCLAIPAAFINSRLGYKGGVLIGLVLAGTGGLLFIPAAYVMTYSVFLTALFTLAAGLSVLETSANPFVIASKQALQLRSGGAVLQRVRPDLHLDLHLALRHQRSGRH